MTSFLSVVALATVHYFASALRVLDVIPRSRWLSFSGGVSVAYVFLHLLPELSEFHLDWQEKNYFLKEGIYLAAALGLTLFYSLERLAKKSSKGNNRGIFWIHISSFSFYNAFIGYLLVSQPVVLFTVAMALHFLVTDYGLRQHFYELYIRRGRLILSLALFAGWSAGNLLKLPEAGTNLLVAFLSGGIILNVLKEELPEERESSLGPFISGVLLYSALLVISRQ